MEKYIVKSQFHLASIRNVVRKSSIISINGEIVTITGPDNGISVEYPRATITELNALKQMPNFMEQYSEELAKTIQPDKVVEEKKVNLLNLEIIDADSDAHPVVDLNIKEEMKDKKDKKVATKETVNNLTVTTVESSQVTEIGNQKSILDNAKAVNAATINEKTEILTKVIENKTVETAIADVKAVPDAKVIESLEKKVDEIGNEVTEVLKLDVKKIKKKMLPLD